MAIRRLIHFLVIVEAGGGVRLCLMAQCQFIVVTRKDSPTTLQVVGLGLALGNARPQNDTVRFLVCLFMSYLGACISKPRILIPTAALAVV